LNSYTVTVRATDGGTPGLTYDEVFVISVTDVNENPTDIDLTNASVAENAGANALVGVLSGSDADAGANGTLTFSLPAGVNDNDLFNIAGTNLQANASFDFEVLNSYTVTVRATDGGTPGLTYDEVFVISVTDVNENPTDIDLTNASVAENAGANALVGVLSGSDADAGANGTLTFSLPAGVNDNDLFNIAGANLQAN